MALIPQAVLAVSGNKVSKCKDFFTLSLKSEHTAFDLENQFSELLLKYKDKRESSWANDQTLSLDIRKAIGEMTNLAEVFLKDLNQDRKEQEAFGYRSQIGKIWIYRGLRLDLEIRALNFYWNSSLDRTRKFNRSTALNSPKNYVESVSSLLDEIGSLINSRFD